MDPSSSKRKRDLDSLDEVRSCKRPKNDVFVNYSFEDTGKSFVSHLKGGLRRNGFAVSDSTMLPIGQDETSELLKAIQDSEIYVVVLSTNYAFSIKCLDELVLIMNGLPEFKERKVFPIFFNVDPSHVRSQQKGSFMEAFQEHETNFDPERIQKWRQALKDAGQLSGLTFQNGEDEAEFILRIVEELEKMQSPQDLHVTDHPVGIGSRAEELISKLRLDCKDQVLVVGVFGIGGIGKTTIVKATYNRIAAKFDVSCFLAVADIHDHHGRQNWKVNLQNMLISYLTKNFKHPITHSHNDGVTKIRRLIRGRKILLVLDDVDKFQQLEELGIINLAWFYNGSRIIVTTRDRQSLGYIPYASYHTTLLNERESLTLFIRVMFAREDTDNTKFIEEVVSRAGGLPLVLKVWSRHFKQYKKEQWPSILETLKRIPHGDVQKQLQLSYDSLPPRSKKLFLDIVFFFHTMKKELVVKVLQDEDSGFFPDIEIQNLVDKGLVEINNDKVSMHQAIREMGQEVVRQENEDSGQRTRLMGCRDVVHVLRDCSGTKSVEGIRLENGEMSEYLHWKRVTVQVEAFKKMSNLRFIQLLDCHSPSSLQWSSSSSSSNDDMSSFSFKKLKYLEWYYFPFKCLDNIDMGNVVVIILEFSKLETLWEGFKTLHKLRILEVTCSRSLTNTGNFVGLEKLEELSLRGCENLEELDGSIGYLEKLVSLDLRSCTQLKSIPNLPPSIEYIRAVTCISLMNLPSNMAELQSLTALFLDNCLKLGSEGFMKVTGLRNLQKLFMRNCNVSQVSSEIGNLVSLQYLDLSENPFSSLPDSFSNLSELNELVMDSCSNLELLPLLPSNLTFITASFCSNLELLSRNTFSSLPDSFSNLLKLEHLEIHYCSQLKSIPNLPLSIKKIEVDDCISLMNLPSNMAELQFLTELYLNNCSKLGSEGFMKVTGLRNLQKLFMRNCNVSQVSSEIGNLVSLQFLDLSENPFSSLPDSFSNLSELKELVMDYCSQLELLPLLPSNLTSIEATRCLSLDVMPYYDSMQTAYVFRSRMLEESFFTKDKSLWISLSGEEEEVPYWCSYRSNEDVLSFVAPIMHLDNKICGVIICATFTTDLGGYFYPTMLNKTKETSHRFNSPECENENENDQSSMFIVFCPLNDKTLVVEAGDTVLLQFGYGIPSCGLRLIYEGDLLDDSTLLIQKQLTEPPFTLTVQSSETIAAAAAPSTTQLYDDSICSFPFQDKEIIYYNFYDSVCSSTTKDNECLYCMLNI